MHLAVIWQRLGPYHHTRLAGAANHFDRVSGIEIASKDQYEWNVREVSGSYEVRTVFPSFNYDALNALSIRAGVKCALREIGPNIVAINGWSVAEAVAGLQYCIKRRIPVVLMSETFVPSKSILKEWIKHRRVKQCRGALVGGRLQADYVHSLGMSRDRIRVGYDTVDNNHFFEGSVAARANAQVVRKELGLPNRYFFANCRFLNRKNIDGLLRAFAMADCDLDLVVSGGGEMERAWRAQADSLGISERIKWPGFLQYDELPAYYGLADCFVHPAHSEAWGLVINEACAAGLPVIASRQVGASAELIREGENGWLFESRNTSELADSMKFVAAASNADLRQMGARSQQIVSKMGPTRFGSGLRELADLAIQQIGED